MVCNVHILEKELGKVFTRSDIYELGTNDEDR
jgi:hypothetical protein